MWISNFISFTSTFNHKSLLYPMSILTIILLTFLPRLSMSNNSQGFAVFLALPNFFSPLIPCEEEYSWWGGVLRSTPWIHAVSPAQCDVMWCTMYSMLDDVYVFLMFLISLLYSFHLCLFVLQTLYISDIVCTYTSVCYTLTEVSRYYFIHQLQLLTILL